jgi:sugar (pentulose or hexulose) kinase
MNPFVQPTCSFLDQQASRLNFDQEFGETALKSLLRQMRTLRVFAKHLIHKQQLGYPIQDLLYGLCQALVRNYLSNLALGKEILPKIVFQGGVATNIGMVKAFEEALGHEVIVPENHQTMGAIGVALLAMENYDYTNNETNFKGWNISDTSFSSITNECHDCSNNCEIISIIEGENKNPYAKSPKEIDGKVIARWGGTCGKWDLN